MRGGLNGLARGGKPLEMVFSNPEEATRRALLALDLMFGEDNYEIVDDC